MKKTEIVQKTAEKILQEVGSSSSKNALSGHEIYRRFRKKWPAVKIDQNLYQVYLSKLAQARHTRIACQGRKQGYYLSSGNKEDQDQSEQALASRIHPETMEENADTAELPNTHPLFEIKGPIPIPRQLFDGKKDQDKFWNRHRELKKRRGVYIFAIETSKGIDPLYVGQTKAAKGFGQECFTDRNQNKCHKGLDRYKEESTPAMFFIMYPKRRGVPKGKVITQVEQFMTWLAEIKNPNLKNDRGRIGKKLSIQGIIGDGRGSSTDASKALRKALGLAEEAEGMTDQGI